MRMKVEEMQDINTIPPLNDNASILISHQELQARFDSLAVELNDFFKDKDPLCLCVIKGAIIFTGHMLTRLDFPLTLDYVHVSRYKNNQADELIWKQYPTESVTGRTIIVFEDILDSGVSLTCIRDWLLSHGAKEVYTVCLLEKKISRNQACIQTADFKAFEIGREFVYGFGLDNNQYWRNAKDIYQFNEGK
jgi:hypoxanthine phosphoribosyltransferase